MNALVSFLKVAETNLRKIRKDVDLGNCDAAFSSLRSLVETLETIEGELDYCPKLAEIKTEAKNILRLAEKRETEVKS